MFRRPIKVGDFVYLRLEVRHKLEDDQLIVVVPSLGPVTIHESDIRAIEADSDCILPRDS